MKPIEQRVKQLLVAGTQATHHKTRHTCANILQLETALWTFVRVEGVEPTNNNAERPLRRAVLWRKKSFGTQSDAGSRFVERILTVVTSLRQQGRDVLDYLTAICGAVGQNSSSSLCLLPQPP
jgi:transposase